MNSPAPFLTHRVDHAPSHALAARAEHTVAQLHGAANEPAAQDRLPDPTLGIQPTQSDDFRNPLWVVAIGMTCLLAAMAAVMAIA